MFRSMEIPSVPDEAKDEEKNQFERIEDSFVTQEAARQIPAIIHETSPLAKSQFIKENNPDVLLKAIELTRKQIENKFSANAGQPANDQNWARERRLIDDFEQLVLGH